MTSIAQRLDTVRRLIAETAQGCGRPQDEVRLLAVSKGQNFSAIEEAYAWGQRDFGESYAQEMALKIQEARAKNLSIRWHYLGALQSNKLALIKDADIIHSVDSLRHAEQLNKLLPKKRDIFLQVNLSSLDQRRGFKADELEQAINALQKMENLYIRGLMTIAPLTPAREPAYWFSLMHELASALNQKYGRIFELSMGMSDDFRQAIAYGAHIVRIGTSIFGARS